MTETKPRLEIQPFRAFDEERRLRIAAKASNQWFFPTPDAESECLSQQAEDDLDVHVDEASDSRERAQELAFQAMETANPEKARSLAMEALELDPECLDARTYLAGNEPQGHQSQLEALRALIQETEARHNVIEMRDLRGRLFGSLPHRPYLRLRLAAAMALVRAGRKKAAIDQLEQLLLLDTPDRLGARFRLVQLLAATGQSKELANLVARFPDDSSLPMGWARLLAKVLMGDESAADAMRDYLARRNPYVEALLVGRAKRPRHLPQEAEPGTLEEACLAMPRISPAWTADRAAIYWLAQK